MRLPWIALALLALVAWLLAPLFQGGLLGAAGTDLFRGTWGFDHQAQAFPLPFWTDRVGFPGGVKLLILPFVSSLLGAPLHWVLGPWEGYNAWVVALLWLGAFCTAWWVKEASGSGGAGLLAGGLMASQPTLLLALTDGTAEHVAFWSIPAMLASLARARTDPGNRWGIAAGVFATIVALDSPYHAIFSVPLTLLPLWRCPPRARWGFLGVAALGIAAVVGLYWGLPLSGRLENKAQNAVKLATWWQWDAGKMLKPWDFTFSPAFVPTYTLLGAAGLAVARPARSLPWVGWAVLCLLFALGASPENTSVLARWWGGPGEAVGGGIEWFNQNLSPSAIRFPRRWLIPMALALFTAAGIGLGRLPREWMRVAVAIPAVIGGTWLSMERTGFREAFPRIAVPEPAFARFVHDHPGEGAAVVLPTVRGASRLHERFELPVFANLDAALVSADQPFLQVALGRALVNSPQGLFTMQPKKRKDTDIERFFQDLNDLCNPQTTGSEVPPSALQEPENRAARARALAENGLRFIVLDDEVYGETGLGHAKLPFADMIVEEQHFDDGTGVTVWVLSP